MIQIKKTILTLALLLTAVTGAWAQSTLDVVEFEVPATWNGDNNPVTAADLPGFKASTLAEAQTWTGAPAKGMAMLFYAFEGNTINLVNYNNGAGNGATAEFTKQQVFSLKSSVKFYYTAKPTTFPFPITWDATNKTTGFSLPAGNVFMNVEYYPVAALTKAPAAKSDIKATTADAIVTAGTVAMIGQTENAQGTLMYYAVQSETAPAAPDYDNQNWSADVPTAADFNQGNVYVWYYVKGADGDAESTFNNGAITKLGETGYVTLAGPPTYAITLAEGTEDVGEWVISQAEGLLGGETITATYSGMRKVKSVKAVKKGGAPDPKLATPLTIEAITPGIISVSSPKEGMQFSLDGGATKNAVTTGQIVLNVGDKVQFYGNGTSITSYYGTTITGSGNGFTCKVYGNIMSLVDETGFATAKTLSANPTFYRLFYENTTLTDASGLLLPATELASYCYSQMFRDCTSLTAAPELPATELASNCYRSMFMGCTALTTAPVLLATTLVESCYYQMFTNCSKLATVTCLAESGINTNLSTANWLNGTGTQAQGAKTVYTVSTANWPEENDSGIPTGWTRVNVDN